MRWRSPCQVAAFRLLATGPITLYQTHRSRRRDQRHTLTSRRAAGLEEPHSKGGKRTSQQEAEEGEGEADPGTFEYDWEARAQARERAFPRPLARPEDEAAGSAHELSDGD